MQRLVAQFGGESCFVGDVAGGDHPAGHLGRVDMVDDGDRDRAALAFGGLDQLALPRGSITDAQTVGDVDEVADARQVPVDHLFERRADPFVGGAPRHRFDRRRHVAQHAVRVGQGDDLVRVVDQCLQATLVLGLGSITDHSEQGEQAKPVEHEQDGAGAHPDGHERHLQTRCRSYDDGADDPDDDRALQQQRLLHLPAGEYRRGLLRWAQPARAEQVGAEEHVAHCPRGVDEAAALVAFEQVGGEIGGSLQCVPGAEQAEHGETPALAHRQPQRHRDEGNPEHRLTQLCRPVQPRVGALHEVGVQRAPDDREGGHADRRGIEPAGPTATGGP